MSFQSIFDAMKNAYERDHPDAKDPIPPTTTPYLEARQLPPVDPQVPSAHVRTAYHLRQGPNMNNGEHAVLDQPLHSGRLNRSTGDALCKPQAKFWGLYESPELTVSCQRCLEMAARHGITIRTAR
ncbi:hypothetical protein [Streptomyces showdoensis]|uniref:hypothetical protein n=1 Tax=Streptomyces showdoensis TaxID=68268 RepID=UPI000F503A51|nr:hypothetical protein [Streptomyces showdoensis]